MSKKKAPPPSSSRPPLADSDLVSTTIMLRREQIVSAKQDATQRQRERGEGRADMSEVVRIALDKYFERRSRE